MLTSETKIQQWKRHKTGGKHVARKTATTRHGTGPKCLVVLKDARQSILALRASSGEPETVKRCRNTTAAEKPDKTPARDPPEPQQTAETGCIVIRQPQEGVGATRGRKGKLIIV